MIYLLQKQNLLQHTDSLFATFLQNAELRLKVGESNILEKTTAETQRGQISVQLRELQQDFGVLQLQFRLLLNTENNFMPAENVLPLNIPNISDTSVLNQHPLIRQLRQQQQISVSRLALEKSRLLPDLLIGLNSQTIRGAGADGKIYSSSHRFQSVQVGIGIPLFNGGQRATIAAGKINVRLAENNYAQGLQQLQSAYQQAFREYNKNLQTINYYETVALKNAGTIIQTANLQFKNGEINYLDWVLLTNNAITIQSQYVEAVRNINQSIIEINSFITQ